MMWSDNSDKLARHFYCNKFLEFILELSALSDVKIWFCFCLIYLSNKNWLIPINPIKIVFAAFFVLCDM